jgi:hypothetical protein
MGHWPDGFNIAAVVGAVMVRVDVAEFAPGVTDVGLRLQVGAGAGPAVTVHVSRIAVAKGPFCGVRVMASVVNAPSCIVKLADAGASEKSGAGGAVLKVAVTNPVMVMLHAPVPEQALLQAAKVEPEAGEAVKPTIVPKAKLAEQELGQFMPAGLLVTIPVPLPESITETVKSDGVLLPSITVTLPLAPFAT